MRIAQSMVAAATVLRRVRNKREFQRLAEEAKPGKRGPAPKLQQQLERLQALPKAKQRMIGEVLDSLIAQAGR